MGRGIRFTTEFKREAVRLVLSSGRPRTEIAEDLGVGLSSLTRWIGQYRGEEMPPEIRDDLQAELKRLRKENAVLRQERDILKKSRGLLREGGKSMRFALIDAEKAEFPVRTMCRVLDVSESGFFSWKGRPASQRQRDDMIYLAHIRIAFELSNRTYGSPRMHRDLVDEGLSIGRRRTARLMARERPGRAPEASFQTNHGQYARLAGRAQSAGPGLRGRGARPEMERRHLLHLDRRGMALSRRAHRPLLTACRRLGCQR